MASFARRQTRPIDGGLGSRPLAIVSTLERMTTADPDLFTLASNLRRLRTGAGRTQEELAEEVGLSRAGYRNIELGESWPKEETLHHIARALGVSVHGLLAAPTVLKHVRFRSLKRLKRREDVLHQVGQWLKDYRELEILLNEPPKMNKLKELEPRVRELRKKGMPAVAAMVRKEFGLDARLPVDDICGVLEAHGVKVHSVAWETDAFFGLSVSEEDGGPAVIVNVWDRIPVEAWIFSAVHELFHLLAHIGSYRVEDDQEVDADHREGGQEHEADEFAGHFLMPQEYFKEKWEELRGFATYDRVLRVKRMFRVSWRTVVYRLALELPTEQKNELWRFMNGEHKRRTGQSLTKHDEPEGIDKSWFQRGRGAEPAKLDEHDFEDNRLRALVRRGVEEGVISLGRAAEILCIEQKEMRAVAAAWFG